MSSLSISSVFRNTARSVAPRNVNLRHIHSTPLALRKARSSQPIEEALPEEEQEEEDLFSTSGTPASSYKLDKSAIRQSNVSIIQTHAKLPPKEKRRDKVPIQALRQVVACSEAEEAEELKKVVRAWRVGGLRVSKATGREIVGRLCNLGKAELASELVSNRVHYGLPDLDQPTILKLHHSLLSSSLPPPKLAPSQPISPTLALLRLSLASQTEGSTPEQITSSLVSSPKGRTWKPTKAVEEWVSEAREKLDAAGGVWADAAKKIQVA
ncbi:hypothetical protein I302_100202 [Kwoniella bestiolae CBS 10118]|uniref:Uncharacterized protein n=1 Tax=Kwoniella bestiolae CBS 10118 TaxID=1296100 RepID=A0A1B9G4D7_9TREE|nr:hypothetical protein I302_03575 [Kwoniella bestiolae CBS 10118]OCF25899.1 hypothetical protein I302_03575 [Kwoniella bestiolae CBS 10118]